MIDGSDFSGFVAAFTAFIKKTVRYTIYSLRNNAGIAVLSLVVVLGLGILAWSRERPVYEATMVVTFTELNKKTYGEMVHDLDNLLKSRSYSTLASQMNIPENDARALMSIEGRNSAGSKLYEDITTDKAPIYIVVTATDKNTFQTAGTALIQYLNTASPYLKERIKTDSANLEAKAIFVEKEIAKMDSYLTAPEMQRIAADTAIFNRYRNYRSDLNAMRSEIANSKTMLRQPVSMLHGFVVPENPIDNKKKILVLTCLAAIVLPCSAAVWRNALRHTADKTRS